MMPVLKRFFANYNTPEVKKLLTCQARTIKTQFTRRSENDMKRDRNHKPVSQPQSSYGDDCNNATTPAGSDQMKQTD